MKPTIKLISTHRIDPEKGWDLIIAWLYSVLAQNDLPYFIRYDIYGDGKMKNDIVALAKQYPENVKYHGFVPIHTIFSGAMDYDFVLMPSRFLETFGLSALDFAQFGIPTIGYKKGGLTQLILDNLNISAYFGNTEQEQFDTAMRTILTKKSLASEGIISDLFINKDTVIKMYGADIWLKQFKTIILSPGKQLS